MIRRRLERPFIRRLQLEDPSVIDALFRSCKALGIGHIRSGKLEKDIAEVARKRGAGPEQKGPQEPRRTGSVGHAAPPCLAGRRPLSCPL
jgi:hypothetical protein